MALHIILGERYQGYKNALKITHLDTLEFRRTKLCLKFAKKAEKDDKHKHWFRLKPTVNTRQHADKYWQPLARTERLLKSPIAYITSLLNKHYK